MKSAGTLVSIFGGKTLEGRRSECEEHGAFTSLHTPGGWSKCPGCMEIYLNSESLRLVAEQNQRSSEASVLAAAGRTGVPKKYSRKGFDAFLTPTEAHVRALDAAREYTRNFEANLASGSCLVLRGNPGAGKTHLACAIAMEVSKIGYSALFMTARELFLSIIDREQGASEMKMIRRFAKIDLLILDEFVGGGSAAESASFFDVLNARYADDKPTILLTNLSLDEFASKNGVGERLFDRLTESGGSFIEFGWTSFRGG
jgi:DNA replication protein DnaC